MTVYLVQLFKFASEFSTQDSCDLFQIFDNEEKCFNVFNTKDCYNWEIAIVGAFNTETGKAIDGFVPYCLVNNDIVPEKVSLSVAFMRFS